MSVRTAPDAIGLVMNSAPGFASLLEAGPAPRNSGPFDNRPTWDNPTPVFDNRPTWDNWKKK
ncbi:multiple cyclophane-containing RiPP AmcA [Streptomyces sp. NPDC006798]|uniref:multiple cyclophane-containing RiPP AmcA n=1 Tax=Streptomyces sp. NPDC006798 TaxID=3155462 RepID=UPI0033FED7AD